MAPTTDSETILQFWLDEIGPKGWYASRPEIDEAISSRFGAVWDAARGGGWLGWTPAPRSTLALLIVLDQFPRNMFRNDPRAFATDRLALSRAKCALDKGWDLRIDPPARQFFYLPLMHSESLVDQDRAVRLFAERMPDASDNLMHAKAHRDVIRRFGRFPHRNSDLNRATTPAERAFLDEGGYRSVVDTLRVAS